MTRTQSQVDRKDFSYHTSRTRPTRQCTVGAGFTPALLGVRPLESKSKDRLRSFKNAA